MRYSLLVGRLVAPHESSPRKKVIPPRPNTLPPKPGIFISLGSYGDQLEASFVASFEFTHFVMFFVGVGIIFQTLWSIQCNGQYQKIVWRACSIDTAAALTAYAMLKERIGYGREGCWLWRVFLWPWQKLRLVISFEYSTVKLQLFRMIFLDVNDLPSSFSFAHYASLSLNAMTVEFIDGASRAPPLQQLLLYLLVLSTHVVVSTPLTYSLAQ